MSDRQHSLPVRRRWWNTPICWVRRHRHKGEPMVLIHAQTEPDSAMVVFEQRCGRCGGKAQRTVGLDCAHGEYVGRLDP